MDLISSSWFAILPFVLSGYMVHKSRNRFNITNAGAVIPKMNLVGLKSVADCKLMILVFVIRHGSRWDLNSIQPW